MDMTEYAQGESRFLKSSDLKGRQITLTIAKVSIEEFHDDEKPAQKKPAIYFQGKDKGVVLNKTNTQRLIDKFGPDSESWRGNQVMLDTIHTQMGPGISVTPLANSDPSDEIPF